jgi:hypothetical protein
MGMFDEKCVNNEKILVLFYMKIFNAFSVLSTVLQRHVDFLEELASEIQKNPEHVYVISGNARTDLQTLQQNSSQYELAINFLDDDSLEDSLKRLSN